jgi:hypothetical protein
MNSTTAGTAASWTNADPGHPGPWYRKLPIPLPITAPA